MMEWKLHNAVVRGRDDLVREVLLLHPSLDVNWRNPGWGDWTALHIACRFGFHSVVGVLLSHPAIDVAVKDVSEDTPFHLACYFGWAECVRLLQANPDVLINQPGHEGYTPLRMSAFYGWLDVVKRLIASRKPLDLGLDRDEKTDAIGAARIRDNQEVLYLLESFREDPYRTRHAVRRELRNYDEATAEIFALLVFFCDDFLRLRSTMTRGDRFFRIARQLPMELQMTLCNRVMGSMKNNIARKETEMAFKELARGWLI